MQSTEGITVSLSPFEINLLKDALGGHIVFNHKELQKKDVPDISRIGFEKQIKVAKELFHRIHNLS